MPGGQIDPEDYGLPPRIFLYTLDQIGTMLQVGEINLKANYLHYIGRSVGTQPPGKMLAHNIAPDGQTPEWRVSEKELMRWMRYKKFRFYHRTWPTN